MKIPKFSWEILKETPPNYWNSFVFKTSLILLCVILPVFALAQIIIFYPEGNLNMLGLTTVIIATIVVGCVIAFVGIRGAYSAILTKKIEYYYYGPTGYGSTNANILQAVRSPDDFLPVREWVTKNNRGEPIKHSLMGKYFSETNEYKLFTSINNNPYTENPPFISRNSKKHSRLGWKRKPAPGRISMT